jgi:release factor glutamine methyltransferase
VNVARALRDAAARLEATSDTARLDAELLMAHALNCDRSWMLLNWTGAVTPATFADLIERRARHEPVAYITGKQAFYGREFAVTPAVLIPRPDSETVVAVAIEAMPEPQRILDLGTGSGALLLTLLEEAPWSEEGVGIDASKGALDVAQSNGKAPHLARRARFLLRDWHQPGWADDLGRFDLIVANPPYVEEAADLAPSVRDYEPAEALFAGPEGLDDYRALFPQLPALLTPEGVAVIEIGAGQAESVAQLAAAAGFSSELRRDLANRPRALILRIRLGNGPASG